MKKREQKFENNVGIASASLLNLVINHDNNTIPKNETNQVSASTLNFHSKHQAVSHAFLPQFQSVYINQHQLRSQPRAIFTPNHYDSIAWQWQFSVNRKKILFSFYKATSDIYPIFW